MPWENIDKAIKRGTGEIEGEKFETIMYEGYGPGGTAIMVEAMTEKASVPVPAIMLPFVIVNPARAVSVASPACFAFQVAALEMLLSPIGKAP